MAKKQSERLVLSQELHRTAAEIIATSRNLARESERLRAEAKDLRAPISRYLPDKKK